MKLPKIDYEFVRNLVPNAQRNFKVGKSSLTETGTTGARNEFWTVVGGNPGGRKNDITMFEAVDRESYDDLRIAIAYLTRAKNDMKEFIKSVGAWEAYKHSLEMKYEMVKKTEPSHMVKRGLTFDTVYMTISEILTIVRYSPDPGQKLPFGRKFYLDNSTYSTDEEFHKSIYFMNLKGRINNFNDGYMGEINESFNSDALAASDWCFLDYPKPRHEVEPITIGEAIRLSKLK